MPIPRLMNDRAAA